MLKDRAEIIDNIVIYQPISNNRKSKNLKKIDGKYFH